MEAKMKRATIRTRRDADAALSETGDRFIKAWKTGKSDGVTLQFESAAALFRELERDVKRVHEDVGELMACGLITREENGKFRVPYEVIHADFDLRVVA
jgi:hypothetical protein